jgi:hypothetical protein
LSPERPGNDVTARNPRNNAPVTAAPDPTDSRLHNLSGVTQHSTGTQGTVNGLPLGMLFLGVVGVVSLADTKVAPVAVAFLAAAVIYNASPLLERLTKG